MKVWKPLPLWPPFPYAVDDGCFIGSGVAVVAADHWACSGLYIVAALMLSAGVVFKVMRYILENAPLSADASRDVLQHIQKYPELQAMAIDMGFLSPESLTYRQAFLLGCQWAKLKKK
ncbi:hypothetical protein A4U49_09575 [Acidithiobacillus ferrivorans]|nr:hypothetical protein A4U49_09575 [Acidithiobacillus ferrivorans]